ncbi:FAD binding domain-containing protein [Aaosphaeria arxii CBS 175.79]|uniref:FAD binding domain-containing protein n=1 Tax=Aaosphaeria arxii CBS 175.79 TaxID=1450172 RepID=A0A6A5YAT0_9PLEO|nr:FAD binding domain-containing protein [Aaosphaeria arxii CBS 175.79]KAF2022333.1 FAD binding domain-containing protein [Aaosphaeria arxii CBS 175.79]
MAKSPNVFGVLEPLLKTLKPSEVVKQDSAEYSTHTQPFAAQNDLYPSVALVPEDTQSLSRIIHFLYTSKLDFNIRGHGLKSPSAHDVIISMTRFKGFTFDSTEKTVSVGAGMTWLEVQEQMREVAPDHTVMSARAAHVGVAGSIQLGGISWLSGERGWISDPANFIDAEVVKYDGSVANASDEPDLLFALRGGGGGFGIVTKVTLRAFPYPDKIWSGNIIVLRHELPRFARGLATFISTNPTPSRVSALLIIPSGGEKTEEGFVGGPLTLQGSPLILQVYDANGSEHGREVFRFALEIPGAMEHTSETDSLGVMDLRKSSGQERGAQNMYSASLGLADVDSNTILRGVEWVDNMKTQIGEGSMMIFQLFASSPHLNASPGDCAWPRPTDMKHILLYSTGCDANASSEQSSLARQLAIDAPQQVLGGNSDIHIAPLGLEEFHDPRPTFGAHWEKLVNLRSKYDPERRFKGLIGHEL